MLRQSGRTGRGWIRCGSANMSASAWGVGQRSGGGGGGGSFSISLFELGVLLTDVRLADYDIPFEYASPRRYDAEADEPAGGPW